jgi:hypothetical protein
MTEYPFLGSLDLSQSARLQLSTSLDRIVSGNDTIVLSGIGVSNDPETLLSEWDKIFNSNKSVLNNEILQIEQTERSKYGPRSVAIPWLERKDSVLGYYGTDNTKEIALQWSDLYFRKYALRPTSLNVAIEGLKNSTSSGLPWMKRKGDIKMDLLENYNYYLQRKDPCVLFTRTQEMKKTRNVWGVCSALVAFEQRYYRPILSLQRNTIWRSALVSPTSVDHAITDLLTRSVAQKRSFCVSGDFPAYDSTLKGKAQRNCFNFFKLMFQSSYHSEIDYIADRFRDVELVTPDGILSGPHGVPSGSTFTNEVDSVNQYLILRSGGVESHDFQIQGDDNAISTAYPDKIFRLFEDAGFKLSDTKTVVSSTSFRYLQNYYSLEYADPSGNIGGIYSIYRALNRIVYPERYDDYTNSGIVGSDYNSIRTISILENCKNHPLYVPFVKFILDKDKYSLKFSENGLNNYVQRIIQSSGTEDIFRYRYGDDLVGIRSFETVKVISELSSRV